MRIVAQTMLFAVVLLTGLRHFGIMTEIPKLDRWVGLLIESIYGLHGYLLT